MGKTTSHLSHPTSRIYHFPLLEERNEILLKKITFDNGVRIVCEKLPYVKSITIGIWVGTGAKHETNTNKGISHFIEHIVFKGTSNRSARDIAECIDAVGGQLNAFTGRECTCYYVKVLDTHLDLAVDVLADIFFNSRLDHSDIELEKNVILEEISMYQDTLEELVHDNFAEMVWGKSPLGRPVLGTSKSVRSINRDMISEYMDKNYRPDNTVISVAGNYDYDELVEILSKYFGNWALKQVNALDIKAPTFNSATKLKYKKSEQVHLCMGFEGIKYGTDDIYTLLAINNIFGGGMSSRLFQSIRENKGLVYSIYSCPTFYKETGLFSIYAGMSPDNLDTVIEMIRQEIDLLAKNGLTTDQLIKSKEQIKGNYILGMEGTSGRMNSNGKSELTMGRIFTQQEMLKKIDNITMKDAMKMIGEIFNIDKISIYAIGNIKNRF